MKPLNLDNSPCSPISSNCVIWQGPDIPCIKLCKGDTISDVVHKLATELCTILDYLNVDNYNLSCFNLASCSPNNFQELLQFIIERICALENIDPATVTVSTVTGTQRTNQSELVTNYMMQRSSVFGGGTVKLPDYVQEIADRVSNNITQISIINSSINSLDIRVTNLESVPAPIFVIPSFILQCDIGTIIPVLAAGSSQDIDVVLSRFINEEWCPYKAVFDSANNLSNAITSQCILGTDDAEALKYSVPGTQMQVAYPGYVAAPGTLADAVNNLWIALCDVRNAGDELVTVTAGNNVTITPSTTIVGSDEVIDYLIDAKDTIVTAGDNVTVTSVTSPTDVTTYTINGKEAIVAGSGDITVTPVTIGNDTTYTVGLTPKINFYDEVVSSIDLPSDPGFIDLTYFSPTGYNVLQFINTSGSTKDYIVNVSADMEFFQSLSAPDDDIASHVDTGLILSPGTILYESEWRPKLEYRLWDTVTNSIITGTTVEKVLTTAGLNPVTTGIGNGVLIPGNVAFFKKITLTAGQIITVMFKGKLGVPGNLLKAQLFVQEL
jgi:hypothetical protein